MTKSINYDKRVFRSISNTSSGEVDGQTIFYYHQKENILTAKYSGGQIVSGQMLGTVEANGTIRFHYQHINEDGQMRSGSCVSHPEIMDSGAIRLYESWQWADGNKEKGKSIVEEMKK